MSAAPSLEIGKITLPFGEAFRIAMEDIRRRFVRMMITAASVILAVGFMDALLVLTAVGSAMGGQAASLKPFQLWILFISLLVCVVGIMNSMLIAVAERTREIGTWKCLGALDRHVLLLFLIEAMLIGLVGGIAGWFIGIITGLIYSFQPNVGIAGVTEALTSPSVIALPGLSFLPSIVSMLLLSLLIAISLSMIGTLYPAYRAAKLNPAEALRYEV